MSSNALGGIRRLKTALSILLTVGSAARLAPAADDGRKPAQTGRTPWTTSTVVGSPEPPPPFKVVRAFPNLKFQHPLLIARYPEGNRLVVGEQSGILYSFPDRPDARSDLFLDLRRELKTVHRHAGAKEVEAVYGLVFHPEFEQIGRAHV